MLDMSADISGLEQDVVDKIDEDMFMGNDDNFDIDGDKTGVFKVSINFGSIYTVSSHPPLYGASGYGPSQKFDWIIDGQHRFGRRWHKSPRLFWYPGECIDWRPERFTGHSNQKASKSQKKASN
jgi:hypothetical protein